MMATKAPPPPSRAKYSIPTEYRSTRFRSKLEADWARAFDALGIEWEYERQGKYFGDVFYLVDFWLPRSRQYVEVKGVFEPSDCRKIHALLQEVPRRLAHNDESPDIALVAAMSDGDFFGWEKRERRNKTPDDWMDFLTKGSLPVSLLRCTKCRGWWFADMDWSWSCQCCGARRCMSEQIESPLPGFPEMDILRRIGGLEADI